MRFSVTAKLFTGFGAVIVLSALTGAMAIFSLGDLSQLAATLYARDFRAARQVEAARAAAFTYRLSVVGLIHTVDEAERQTLTARMRDTDEVFTRAMQELEPLLITPEAQSLSSQITQAWAQYTPVSEQVVSLALAGRIEEADELSRTAARDRKDAIDELLVRVSDVKDRLAADQARRAEETYQQVLRVTVILVVVALLTGIGAVIWLARSIGNGVRATANTAALIAAGDLRQTVSIHSRDEIGDLGEAFNRMVDGLREVTREIRSGVQSMAGATGEILASVTQQGASTTEQAAAVSQTTATVDEVRVTAQQVTQRAQAVAAMAQRAAEVAGQGLGTVERTVVGMQEIRGRVEAIAEQILALSEQTQQVGEIIATVEDLADQSNLLAVNAAIEASRAGEQGRGFAVVAQEVRSLAERSKTATVQVRTILTDIQRATNAAVLATEQGTRGAEEGGRLVEQAGQAIRQLAATIGESAEAAQQIVASAGQQNAGMDQIAGAMASINQATTETAAGTRQLQTAAQNLEHLARRLADLISQTGGNQPSGNGRG